MPSFDIVNRVDLQELDNAVNNVKKEIQSRYDFRGSRTEVELDKKEKVIKVVTDDDMKVRAVKDMLVTHLTRRKVDPKSVTFGETEPAGGLARKSTARIREGIDTDTAKKVVKAVKDTGLKVQASIQDNQVRVTGKKIDDLQAVMQSLREADFGVPTQFVNLKRD